MKKFKVRVLREDEYEIEIDENKYNEEWMESFRGVMYDFKELKEHAGHIGQFRARFGEKFIEGYGSPMVDGEMPFGIAVDSSRLDELADGINIKVISEDYDINTEVYPLDDDGEVIKGEIETYYTY